MCVIVDNNLRDRFLSDDARLLPLKSALHNRRTVLVYGGRLAAEYKRSARMRHYLTVLVRMGAAREVADDIVNREEQCVARDCTSDDAHVIALARVGKVRLLCTKDAELIAILKNRNLINDPPGSIYALGNRKANDRLIREHCHCHG